jgi:hypothetical protein
MALSPLKNDDVSLVFAWFARVWERLYEVAGDVLGKTGAVIMGREMLSSRLTMSRGWSFLMTSVWMSIRPCGLPPQYSSQSLAIYLVKTRHKSSYMTQPSD